MKRIITLLIVMFAIALQAQTTPGKHSVKNLDVNTKLSEFSVAKYGEDRIVFAAPSEEVTIVRRVWRENNQPYLDIWVGDIDSTGQIINKRAIEGDVNRKLHDAVVTFTKDGKTAYFSANNYNDKERSIRSATGFDNIQLYKADVAENGDWINVEKLPFNSDEWQTGLPTLNKDETKLYFVSDRPESIGKTDIFVVDIKPDGTYGEPKNLGPKVNTEEREMFPYISDDNILYFSSTGHPGYGNLDVFAVKIFDNTISDALNLEEPINSPKDDFAYFIENEKHKGYFSSNRKEGKGDDDIYAFNEDEELYIECLQTVRGVVRDRETKELIIGAIVFILDEDGNQLQITASHEDDASYSFDVPCNGTYTLVATNEGYLKYTAKVKTINDLGSPAIEKDIEMANEFISVGDELLVNIDIIYFDFDKYDIRPDAALELDKVIEVMNKYPELKIHATSHTDARGSKRYNKSLSNKRAKSSVEYIISKGIDVSRITGEGKGEEELVNECIDGVECTEEQHQLNRRTKFRVVEEIKVKQEQ
jgi:outer membrane protein OmpA-like peptidoglycan-associated protein